MECIFCGSTHTEEHESKPGDWHWWLKPGDWHWWLCRDCGKSWDVEGGERDEVRTDQKPEH